MLKYGPDSVDGAGHEFSIQNAANQEHNRHLVRLKIMETDCRIEGLCGFVRCSCMHAPSPKQLVVAGRPDPLYRILSICPIQEGSLKALPPQAHLFP